MGQLGVPGRPHDGRALGDLGIQAVLERGGDGERGLRPRNASASEAASNRSPGTTSAPAAASARARPLPGSRTTARTARPASSRAATTAPP